ncbi:hypothetical protein BKA65DRAFT_585845 [Rhexocercosporidium sp. MPI-PUGE-AT-0058]|nr:hypothetical protein BKA65DRAFT_585845 [Rhexocercosporidium sp. MPI-PUGE-AT-0058]
MPLNDRGKTEFEDTHQTQNTFPSLRHKRSSLFNPFRSRSSSEHLRQRAAAPIIPETVPEVREGPILKSSSSAMFIAKMKSELFLSQFKRAQEAYLTGDLNLCQHRCTELLETPALHLDTRIETLQLLATIVPLPVAQEHLSDALCLLDLAVERGGIAQEQMQALLGLRITTLDILARLGKEIVLVGREEEAAEWKAKGSLRGHRRRASKYNLRAKIIYQPLVTQVAVPMPLHHS